MAKIEKKVVLNKFGKKIRLNDAALKIALKHFGIIDSDSRSNSMLKEVPIEFLRLPKKIEIIKAKPVVEEKKIEPVIEPVIIPKVEVVTSKAEPVVEVKKKGRKKNERTAKS